MLKILNIKSWGLPGLEVWNRIFFAKVTRLLHENDQKYFIESNLHGYLHIFPTSPEGDEWHANKTVRLLIQTSLRKGGKPKTSW